MGSPGTGTVKVEVLKNPILVSVAEKLSKSPAQIALRWGLQMGHSVLPKSTNEVRIGENFDVFDWSIPEDLFVKLSEINQASYLSAKYNLENGKDYDMLIQFYLLILLNFRVL